MGFNALEQNKGILRADGTLQQDVTNAYLLYIAKTEIRNRLISENSPWRIEIQNKTEQEILSDIDEMAVVSVERFKEFLKNNKKVSIKEDVSKEEQLGKLFEKKYEEDTARQTKSVVDKIKNFFGVETKDKGENIFGDKIEGYEEKLAEQIKENRLNEQAALILTMDELLSKIGVPSSANTEQSSELITPKNRLYKNFIPIRSSKDEGINKITGHSFFTKTMTKTPAMNSFFRKIPPQVMSFLVPSIKVYKTFFPIDQYSSLTDRKIEGYDWRIPFDDIPVSYRGETSEFAVDNIEKVLSGNGGLHSVGIKSFSYKYRGVNPAEVNTNIHASMTIFFQNPAELVREIKFNFGDSRFVTNPTDIEHKQILNFSYSDLVNQSSRTGEKTDQFNEQYYRIKVECGYATPPNKIINEVLESAGYDEAGKQEIKEAIASSKVVLFLTPYQYDVNFREEGSVLLTIDFTAAIDSLMATPDADVFVLTEQSRKLKELSDKFLEYIKATKKEKQIDKLSEEKKQCLPKEQISKIIEEFKQKYPDIASLTTEQVLRLLEEESAVAYNSLFSYLTGKETIHEDSINNFALNPKVYIAKFKPDILGINEDADNDQKRLQAFERGNQLYGVETTFDEGEKFIYGDGASNAEKATNSLNKDSTPDPTSKSYNIKFILLGDLLDLILESLNYVKPLEDSPRIFIGGIPIVIPTRLSQTQTESIYSDLVELTPNLADIPISLNLLKEFLIKNIVKDQKTRYPTIQFLNDILSQLIYPAISPRVFGKETAIRAATRFSTFNFSSLVENNLDPITGETMDKRNYIRFNEGYLSNTAKVSSVLSEQAPQVSGGIRLGLKRKKFANYMFIVCTSKFPSNLTGNEEDDVNNKGVLHFRMGTETGIIKKINFKKINIQYQREMIARREGRGRGTALKQFYNATIDMFGNNIFRPGDFIYIHPNYMFVSREKESPLTIDLETKLGFGGYYLIKDVETSINDMQFETKLECLFQASVERDKDLKKVIPANDELCE
jgi:hypothetical protein